MSVRGSASGGAEHSFPEASTLPGVPLREGDSQRHVSDSFFPFIFLSLRGRSCETVVGWGGQGGGVGAISGVFGYMTGKNDMDFYCIFSILPC